MKIDSPIHPTPAESVRDLNNLPCIASSGVPNVYTPGEATTRRYSRPISRNKGASWYQSRTKHLDLFAVPSMMGLIQQPPHSRMGHVQPVIPFVLGSNANLLFSQPVHPGWVADRGLARRPMDSHWSQAQVLSPAYVAQPLFVYPSGLPQPGGSPDAQFPRPVCEFAAAVHVSRSGGWKRGYGDGDRTEAVRPAAVWIMDAHVWMRNILGWTDDTTPPSPTIIHTLPLRTFVLDL